MFYAAQSALASENVRLPRKHSGVISLFRVRFVKSGKIEKKFADYLSSAFALRQEGDYDVGVEFEKSSVEELINKAEEFLYKIKVLL